MPALLILTAAGFVGFAALLPVAPLWAVTGGANEAGSGLVNGMLMFATILTQPFVPALLRRFGTGRVLAAGLVLLNGPSLLHLVSSDLQWILALSALRGIGFGIITVTGSATVARLVPPARHGAAIGAYGVAVAVPQLLLLPIGPWLANTVGYWLVFAAGTLPVLAVGAAPRLGRVLQAQEHKQGQKQDQKQEQHRTAPAPAASGQSANPAHLGEKNKEGEPPGQGRFGHLARALVPPMVILLGVTLAGGALLTFVPQMSTAPAATVAGLTLLTATAALSRWRLGALADRHGAQAFVWPLILFTVAGLVLAAVAVVDPNATRTVPLLLGMTLVGVAYGGLQNLTLLLSLSAVHRDEYDTASAVWNIGFDSGTGIGSVLVGTIAAGLSFPAALLAAACASILTLPVALLQRRRPVSVRAHSG